MDILKVIRGILEKMIDDIDAGNSTLSEEEAISLAEYIATLTNHERPLSKYEACKYIGVSRATFDNLVHNGFIPKGKKYQGFKELSWNRRELDKYLKNKDRGGGGIYLIIKCLYIRI